MAIRHRPPRLSACISTREALGTYWGDLELKRLPELSWRRSGGEIAGNNGRGATATPKRSSAQRSYSRVARTHRNDAVRTGLSKMGRQREPVAVR